MTKLKGLAALGLLALPIFTSAEPAPTPTLVKVFLDCAYCDGDYVKTEVKFADFVRDRGDADVHILVIHEPTGGGGAKYTFNFIGKGPYAGIDETLAYDAPAQATADETRQGIVRYVKLGLTARYVIRTPLRDNITIGFELPKDWPKPKDGWDSWTFTQSFNSQFDGQKTMSSRDVEAAVSADRITQDLKLTVGYKYGYNQNRFVFDDKTIESLNKSQKVSGLAVKSITDHWSVGGLARYNSSTFDNDAGSTNFGPAIEYDFFPYSQSVHRQLSLLYGAGVDFHNYIAQTIYHKTQEVLGSQFLRLILDFNRPWGTLEVVPFAGNYFNYFTSGSAGMYSNLSIKLAKGLALDLFGFASYINEQRNLSAAGLTEEEILLKTRQLATSYQYSFRIGLRYTFGSRHNKVVNPRFGGMDQY